MICSSSLSVKHVESSVRSTSGMDIDPLCLALENDSGNQGAIVNPYCWIDF
jgi:hypothetical protein